MVVFKRCFATLTATLLSLLICGCESPGLQTKTTDSVRPSAANRPLPDEDAESDLAAHPDPSLSSEERVTRLFGGEAGQNVVLTATQVEITLLDCTGNASSRAIDTFQPETGLEYLLNTPRYKWNTGAPLVFVPDIRFRYSDRTNTVDVFVDSDTLAMEFYVNGNRTGQAQALDSIATKYSFALNRAVNACRRSKLLPPAQRIYPVVDPEPHAGRCSRPMPL